LSANSLKEQIETKLKQYIHRFVRYAGYSHLTQERREIVAGTFAYLNDDSDLIPDDVPNIGFLDDLMVFVEASKHFLSSGAPISGVCNPDEVLEDLKFIEKNSGLMYGNQNFSIDTVRKLGKRHVNDLPMLTEKIKEKYKDLGDFEDEK
jgi:hypothetical protein